MPIPKTQNRHPLFHDLREIFKFSNTSLAAICNSHPNSISYLLYQQRNYPKIEKRLYKLHEILTENFSLIAEAAEKNDERT